MVKFIKLKLVLVQCLIMADISASACVTTSTQKYVGCIKVLAIHHYGDRYLSGVDYAS